MTRKMRPLFTAEHNDSQARTPAMGNDPGIGRNGWIRLRQQSCVGLLKRIKIGGGAFDRAVVSRADEQYARKTDWCGIREGNRSRYPVLLVGSSLSFHEAVFEIVQAQ